MDLLRAFHRNPVANILSVSSPKVDKAIGMQAGREHDTAQTLKPIWSFSSISSVMLEMKAAHCGATSRPQLLGVLPPSVPSSSGHDLAMQNSSVCPSFTAKSGEVLESPESSPLHRALAAVH